MANGLTYIRTLHNEAEVDELAATLAPLLHPGDVLTLNGALCAGKTRFVQGVARALGVEGEVTSPTFTIHAQYPTHQGMPLNHFDLYRLENEDALEDIGYWEILEGDGVSFIEWADKFPQNAPSDFIEVRLSIGEDNIRTIKAHAYGSRARRLLCVWASKPEAQWQKAERF